MSQAHHIQLPPRKVIVITAPSGSGKSSIVRKLIMQRTDLQFSVSCTTRAKRAGEIDGKDYYFIDTAAFAQRQSQGDFVEHQEVYTGQHYGTLKSEVERIWAQRKVVLFDIDVHGATNIKKIYGQDALVIFIAPPDIDTLRTRLMNRGTESKESLKKRVTKAALELDYQTQADKIVINSDFDIAFMNVKNVITNYLKPQLATGQSH
jgi:guanylate kinase